MGLSSNGSGKSGEYTQKNIVLFELDAPIFQAFCVECVTPEKKLENLAVGFSDRFLPT